MAHIDPRAFFLLSASALSGCACGDTPALDAGPRSDARADVVDASADDASASDAGALDAEAPDAFDEAQDASPLDAARDTGVTFVACEGRPLHAGLLPCVDVPCGVLETIEIDPPHSRNDRPDVALDADGRALVAYTIAEGGYHAYLARRSGDSFVSARAGTAAVLAITTGLDGCGYAFLNDGAFGAGVHRIEGDRFTPTFVRDNLFVAGGRLVMSPEGALHAIGVDERSSDGTRLRFDGAATESAVPSIDGSFGPPGALALRPDGTLQTAYFVETSSSTSLMTQLGDEAPVRVDTLDRGDGRRGSVAIAVGGDGRAHILYETPTGDVGVASSGEPWTSTTLFDGAPATECPPPEVEGASCTTRELRWAALGVVAAEDGDALGIVSRNQIDTVLKVVCGGGVGIDPPPPPPPGPPPLCRYEEQSRASSSGLHAVSIQDDAVTSTEVANEGGGAVGTIALAPDGTVHVVTYDPTSAVRYTSIAPLD